MKMYNLSVINGNIQMGAENFSGRSKRVLYEFMMFGF